LNFAFLANFEDKVTLFNMILQPTLFGIRT